MFSVNCQADGFFENFNESKLKFENVVRNV